MKAAALWLMAWTGLCTGFFHAPRPSMTLRPSLNARLQMVLDEAVIVGSGPVGLATAIMFAQNGVKSIKVFDQLKEPVDPDDPNYWGKSQTERNYNMGLSGRTQVALTSLGVWDQVKARAAEVYAAMYWRANTPLNEPIVEQKIKRYATYCIERERLSGCLLQEIRKKYSDKIEVTFNTKCVDVNVKPVDTGKTDANLCTLAFAKINEASTPTNPSWDVESRFYVNTSFIVGADGTKSVVRDYLIKTDPEFKTVAYDDPNVYYYRTLPLEFPKELTKDKYLTISGQPNNNLVLEALPTKEGTHLTAILFKPEYSPNLTTLEDGKRFFQDNFPYAIEAVKDDALLKFISSKDFKFPKFQYTSPKLHYKSNIVLLGDAIHSVKPYFGLGVNAGFEDVTVLRECLLSNQWDMKKSIEAFSNIRAPEAKAFVSSQYKADKNFFFKFILPLILDKSFRKLPFFKNIIADTTFNCFQNEAFTYTGALKRKRRDRFIQISVLAALVTGAIAGSKFALVDALLPLLRRTVGFP